MCKQFALKRIIMSEAVRLGLKSVAWKQIEEVLVATSAVNINHIVIGNLQNYAEGYESGGQQCLDTNEYFIKDGLSIETECTFCYIQGTETRDIVSRYKA